MLGAKELSRTLIVNRSSSECATCGTTIKRDEDCPRCGIPFERTAISFTDHRSETAMRTMMEQRYPGLEFVGLASLSEHGWHVVPFPQLAG